MKKFRIILALAVLVLTLSCTAMAANLVFDTSEITYDPNGFEVSVVADGDLELVGGNTINIKYTYANWTASTVTSEIVAADDIAELVTISCTKGTSLTKKASVNVKNLAVDMETDPYTYYPVTVPSGTKVLTVKFVPKDKEESVLLADTFTLDCANLNLLVDGTPAVVAVANTGAKATLKAAAKEPTIIPSSSKAEGTLTGQYGNPDRKYIADQLTLKNVAAEKEVKGFAVTFTPTVDSATVPADKNPQPVTKPINFAPISGGADIVLNVVLIDIPSYITDVAITGTPVYVD